MIQVVKNGIKWKKLQKLACLVAMETFIRNIAKLFIFQHLSIDVNESYCNSETYISGCRCKIFSIKYGCLLLKAKSPYGTYEKLPWKQKSCHTILFPIYWVKTVSCLNGWRSNYHILCKFFGIEEVSIYIISKMEFMTEKAKILNCCCHGNHNCLDR